MSRCKKLISKLNEVGPQYRTQVKLLPSNEGPRHIRHLTEQALRKILNMLKDGNGYPDPADDVSAQLLRDCYKLLEMCTKKLTEVKESRKKRK